MKMDWPQLVEIGSIIFGVWSFGLGFVFTGS